MEIQEKRYDLSGTQLFVQRSGNAKQTILLIHGFLASTFSWRYMIPLLSPHFTVYAVDLPGFGRSDKNTQYDYTLASYAETIRTFIRRQGIDKLTVMAHSMGGQVAMRLAMLMPDTIDRLILIAPSSYLPSLKRWKKMFFRIPFSHQVFPLLFTEKRIYHQLNSVYYRLPRTHIKHVYDGYVTPLKDPRFPRVLARFACSRESDLCSDALQTIGQPTLLLWGRHDRIVPLHVGKRLKHDLPNVRLEIIEETGHLPMEEKPLTVMMHTARFLDIPVSKMTSDAMKKGRP